MSLFSRLKEEMRGRDSQDATEEKKPTSPGNDKGGLFGSIQLKPAQDETSVPPPATSGMTVPSLEEARAELDRMRAQNAQSSQNSGLFRRDKTPENEVAAPAPRETARATSQTAARETVTFNAVSLPPRGDEETHARAVAVTMPLITASDSQENIEDLTPSDKPFRVPSLSQFAEEEVAPAEAVESAPQAATAPASGAEQTIYTPDSASFDAPDEVTVPNSGVEQTVYAPTDSEHRPIIARTEPQTVALQEIARTIETSRSTEIADSPNIESESVFMPTPLQTAVATSDDAHETATEFTPADQSEAQTIAAPIAHASGSSNMTPFQRLMAARAAQSGPPVSRARNDRTAPRPRAELSNSEAPQMQAPQVEVPETEAPQMQVPQMQAPQVEVPETEAPEMEVPALDMIGVTPDLSEMGTPQGRDLLPQIEASQIAAAQIQIPQIELPEASAPRTEVPALDEPSIGELTMPVAAAHSASVESTEISVPQYNTQDAPSFEAAALYPDLSDAAFAGESSLFESAMPMPEIETPRAPVESVPTPESQPSEIENMASRADALIAQARERKTSASEKAQNQEHFDSADEEAEIVPEEGSSAMASSDAEVVPAMPNPETLEPSARPALSLSERLARAPRAELDAAHAEAEALTPEILETPRRENAAPARSTPALSFAERLAARNKPRVEPPAPSAPATAPASMDAAPETPRLMRPAEPSFQPTNAPEPDASSAPESAPEAPRQSASRSFSERLAARTEIDNHLQVPAPESAPTSQDLARQGAELARINEGVDLPEREMKNRAMFRQKHLIFDAVLGSLDQRTMQNPTRETVKPQIERGVDAALRERGLDPEGSERNWLVDEFVREVTDLGALVPMLEDPSVSKIVVTGANDVSVERLGRIERTGVSFRDDDHLLNLVRRIAELSGGRVDAKVPLLDRPLPDGGRIRAKVPPLAPQPTLTIEKSTGNPFVVLKRQMVEKSRGDALPYAQLRERIQQRLLREFEGDAAALAGDQDKLRQQVEEMIGSVIAEEHVAVTRAERASLVMDLLNEIVGLGPIEPLLNDPDVDEVMVNGPYQIYVERKGKLELTSQRFRDNAHVMQVIDRIVAPLGRRVDEKSPMVDGRLRDGSRFNAIIPPLALSGPTMTIRKFARDPFTMSDLINFGTITREAAQFLQAAVEGRLNIVVSGGTGSGKTTTLNVLSSFIPSTERIVTIEDAAELQMRQEHVIRMETRPPNIEGVGEVGIRDLVKNSLRMRPDRIVVGECRGGEALDMLQAMNTGHDGSLTTAHSNGPRDTCKRLETMVMMAGFDLPVRAIREQISMAVQLVVHQERMRDGKRRVTAITEIVGMEGDVLTLQDIFNFEQQGMDDDGRIIGSLQATGMRPKYYETIVDNGGTISMDIFSPKAHDSAPRARLNERGGR